MISIGSVLLWGLVGTMLLTSIMSVSQTRGWSRMSIPYLLGTMFTANRDRAMLVGFLVHLINGWLFALIYAFAFESLGQATVWLGILAGFVHGLFVLIVGLPLLPAMHPRMASERQGPDPTRQLQPPGFLALNYGQRTPLVSLLAHIAYGALLGGFYQLAG